MTLYERLRSYVGNIDNPSPFIKQSATLVAFVIAVGLSLVVPGAGITDTLYAVVGIVGITVATFVALLFGWVKRLERFVLIIPAIDILAIGAFRLGTGGAASYFTSIILLPVVWFALSRGRRCIVYVGVGVSVALMLPDIVILALPSSPAEWLRAFFTPTVFAAAAAIIHALASQSRVQVNSIHELANDKERMLQRTVEYAAQLQESESKFRAYDRMFRTIWSSVTEQAIIGTDVTGLIDAWNPGAKKILGPTAKAAEDKLHIFDFHLPEELEARARELNYPPGETVLNPGFSALVESARLGRAESREWTYVRSDGTHVPVQLSVTKRADEDGHTIGYLFVASDVTQAREVSRLKDEFVGLISHELRTPLSSILGYLELMRDDEDNPLSEEHLQYLGVAERNAHRLLRLVGDLLFTAQVESGKFPLDARDLTLDTIVMNAVESAGPAADAAGITLSSLLPEYPAIVHGDPLRLGQAVDNLISNAIKFTPRGGAVTVSLDVDAKDATVTVQDTGMGIAASEMDQLFSRFFRATTATRAAVPGVGLGLTITKAIVTAHHGQMGVESEEGVGTRFSLSLPLAPVGAAV
ncbi:MAG: ATP-binding protein [Pseudolysinimonas sp.]